MTLGPTRVGEAEPLAGPGGGRGLRSRARVPTYTYVRCVSFRWVRCTKRARNRSLASRWLMVHHKCGRRLNS